MNTTERDVVSSADERFAVAGRILALSEILRVQERAEGPEQEGRDPLILRALAEVVALHGVDFGRGWIQGYWHGQGVAVHQTWVIGRALLGDPS